MPAQKRNFNDKIIKAFFICSCFTFCFDFVFVVGAFVVLQGCKNVAGKKLYSKVQKVQIIRIEAFIELKAQRHTS